MRGGECSVVSWSIPSQQGQLAYCPERRSQTQNDRGFHTVPPGHVITGRDKWCPDVSSGRQWRRDRLMMHKRLCCKAARLPCCLLTSPSEGTRRMQMHHDRGQVGSPHLEFEIQSYNRHVQTSPSTSPIVAAVMACLRPRAAAVQTALRRLVLVGLGAMAWIGTLVHS